jgi:hypothetical protein
MMLLPTSLIGGVVGALLLLWTGEEAFDILVPFLLLFAVALLAFQNQLQAFTMARKHGAHGETWSIVPVGIAAIYGGYFGAALGVILLAVLVVVIDDSLIRLNALKQLISLAVNVSAAVVFLFLGRIDWTITLVMAIAALVGGAIGGAIASRVSCKTAPLDRDCGRPRQCRPSTSPGYALSLESDSRLPNRSQRSAIRGQKSQQQTSNIEHRTPNAEHRIFRNPRPHSALDVGRWAKYGFEDIWILAHTLL